MINALLDSAIPLFTTDIAESLNFLGHIVEWIVTWLPWTGLGIVLFTLILKTITLPLDAYSKISMRKNSLKMEKMRPQLEKLQKQYQNDQQTYNAKMMELYKKNGYSMLGACLPMIVTLVVFMVVLGAFSDYSNFANLGRLPRDDGAVQRRHFRACAGYRLRGRRSRAAIPRAARTRRGRSPIPAPKCTAGRGTSSSSRWTRPCISTPPA